MNTTYFREKIQPILPNDAGIYQFIDSEGEILYIGKAKNIRKRVSSYFTNRHGQSFRIKTITDRANTIEYIIVKSEQDAFLLENTLIKKHQPKYNIRLKDDKSYPYICIKNERFPRVFLMRNPRKDKSQYFGPFTSVKAADLLLELAKKLYPLRTCSYNLTPANIESGKFKVCLEYHIKNCMGPCVGNQSEKEYSEYINQIKNILKGHTSVVIKQQKEKLKTLSASYRYEEAQQVLDKLTLLEKHQSKSTIVNPNLKNIEVFSFEDSTDIIFINHIIINNGMVIQTETYEIEKQREETTKDIFEFVIQNKYDEETLEIITPLKIQLKKEGVKNTIPRTGDRKKLLELSEKNVKYFVHQRKIKLSRSIEHNKILEDLQQDLNLQKLPLHIECFDNSNIQGKHPVASNVVFKNGVPSKKDYRHFNIKTVQGPNDFASMEEIIYRRYKNYKHEDDLPQLIVIDGGKGQLKSALKSLKKLDLIGKTTVIGIAKRAEELFFPGDKNSILLDRDSESLKLLQRLRDEAHRFAITFHRKKRSAASIKSELESISGIGKKTIETLYREFKSLERIKTTEHKKIEHLIGARRAKILKNYLDTKR